GGKYSTRIRSYFMFDLLSRGKSYAGCPYNERYRMLTPIMHGALGQRTVKENSDLVDDEFRKLMQNLYKASTNAKDGFYPKYCFQLAKFETLVGEELELAKITNSLSDFFPIMKFIPNYSIRNKIIESRTKMEAFLGKLIKE
ncbi:8239_t:CDS:2, partial [Racocetra persica]